MTQLLLASGSSTRANLLRQAGLSIETVPPRVDEAAAKEALIAEAAAPRDIADQLAEMKARRVATKSDGLILGADQILVCEGKIYDKPSDRDDARAQLSGLAGKTHELLSAAVIFDDHAPVWRHIGRARLMMRPFGDTFLDEYLAAAGDEILASVGGYQIEGLGAQLFTRVEGDYFSILGLPLLEILNYLRVRGVLST